MLLNKYIFVPKTVYLFPEFLFMLWASDGICMLEVRHYLRGGINVLNINLI